MPIVKPLKIYKASAGSGKTFTLAVEYIKLLINNPDEYKFILAVTFTNKATGEMKTRIISKLYALANGLEDGNDYLDAIKKDDNIKKLNLSDNEIRERCAKALNNIIHDYSRFRIETIDSFFQSIIRNLTRELNLTTNLRVDLNADEVLDMAVNEVIEEIDKDSDVLNSVLSFVREKIERGGNWQINYEVSNFGKNIFKEGFLNNRETITQYTKDIKKLKSYKKSLTELKKTVLNSLKQVGEGFLNEMNHVGIDYSQIKYGNTLDKFIENIIRGELPEIKTRIQGFVDDYKNLVKDSNIDSIIKNRIHPFLVNIVNEILPNTTITVNSVNAINKNINQLMLLNTLNEKVRLLNYEANRFLLADAAHFLNDIIDGSDIPFVYEKSGIWFKHIMIDEFQDTSTLQWENFKPLINNCLSYNEKCLIVGDVKQSIYRWRDSDWQILNRRINTEFKNKVDIETLSTNYRSASNVIHFNNQFFVKATSTVNDEHMKIHGNISNDLKLAYSDVRQSVAKKNEGRGYVFVHNYVADDYSDMTQQLILDKVKELHDVNGIAWNDMTILVRKNKYIPTLCQYFYEHKDEIDTQIVSDEAFRLDSSEAINLIILALTAIANPQDRFAIRNLAIHYQMAQQKDVNIKNDANEFFLLDDEEIKSLLPEGFVNNMNKYSFTSLHELIEELYEVLQLKNIKGQDAYLFYFHDKIKEYDKDNQSDIENFLIYWEDKMKEMTISYGTSDGIKIMSIHKAKGLEFHTVIVPYCDWKISGCEDDLLWCSTIEQPYNTIPIVPINFSSSLEKSIFQSDYRNEELKNNVDNLNLLYVAFTRASENLLIFTGAKPKKKESANMNNIQQIIVESMHKLMQSNLKYDDPYEEPICLIEDEKNEREEGGKSVTSWTFGTPVASSDNKEKKSEDFLGMPYNDVNASFVHEKSDYEFRQSNESNNFILGDEDDVTNSNDYIERGLIYHKIFELISSKDEVDSVIDELDRKGYFDSVLSSNEARIKIKEALTDPIAGHWFDPGWKEFKECSIMFRKKNGEIKEKRPDRVIVNENETIVIDYKSGGKNEKHKEQVSIYMYLLTQMGYKNVKGYVWYFMTGDIIDANDEKGGSK